MKLKGKKRKGYGSLRGMIETKQTTTVQTYQKPTKAVRGVPVGKGKKRRFFFFEW